MGVDRETFRRLLEPLCAMFRRTLDVAEWTVYYQALADIPAPLLEAAVVMASQAASPFMPRPGELRAYAESTRRVRLAARPWSACEDCVALNGYIEVTGDNGVKRLTRCRCFGEHQRRLTGDGIPSTSLLVGAAVDHDDAALWAAVPAAPEPAQVSPGAMEILTEVKTIARQHRMPSTLPPQTDLDGRPLPEWPRRTR